MAWQDHFVPLAPRDPRNADRLNPGGNRLRVRLNIERGQVVDFVVQYETPDPSAPGEHIEVVRYDGSHGQAHYHVLDRRGNEIRKEWLPEHLSYSDVVQLAIRELRRDWRRLRAAFFREDS